MPFGLQGASSDLMRDVARYEHGHDTGPSPGGYGAGARRVGPRSARRGRAGRERASISVVYMDDLLLLCYNPSLE